MEVIACLIYFRYVDIVLMRDFGNKIVNIAEMIQTFLIRTAATDWLRNPRWFLATHDYIFPFFCCHLIVQFR